MAFEVAPLKPTVIPQPQVVEQPRIEVAQDLFKRGVLGIEDAAQVAGITPQQLEQFFLEKGVIRQDTILVCGGAGFIGSNFVRHILKTYPYNKVVVYDALTYAGNKDNLAGLEDTGRYVFYKGDIADKEHLYKVIKKENIDYIVNFAAETHVTRSLLLGADDFIKTNVTGVHNLLESLRDISTIKRLVHISTDEVYGTLEIDEKRKFFETDPFEPNVPYSATKAGGDLLARAWYESYKVPVIVTHCTNNYGEYQHPEKLIPHTLFRLFNQKPALVHGAGQHIRDWIFVEDHCKAVDAILRNGKDGEVYNVAGGNERTTLEVVKALLKALDMKDDYIEFTRDRPGNDLRYALHTGKIENEIGWRPHVSFEQGIERTIQWYKDNPDWVQAIQKKDKEFIKYT